MKRLRISLRLLGAAFLLGIAGFLLPRAAAADVAQLLQTVSLPQVLGSDTFNLDGTDIHRIVIPQYVVEACAEDTTLVQPASGTPPWRKSSSSSSPTTTSQQRVCHLHPGAPGSGGLL